MRRKRLLAVAALLSAGAALVLGLGYRHSARHVAPTPWVKATGNPIISGVAAWEESAVGEPGVVYDSGTWKMWYGGGWTDGAVGYATCTGDPTVAANWTKYAGNPVLGQGGSGIAGYAARNSVVKIGSTYYMYYSDAAGGGNLKVATSSDGISWGTPTTALAKTAVAWMPGGWANSTVWNEGGTTWKMLVEGSTNSGGGGPWAIAYATSTDGLTWTVVGTGPLTSLSMASYSGGYGAPEIAKGGAKINGRYQLWLNEDLGSNSDIWHASSADAQTWTLAGQQLTRNGGAYEKDQVGDPSVVEVNGVSYLFYAGTDNSGQKSYIGVATYPGTLASLALWGT